jgi:hypothetical protein
MEEYVDRVGLAYQAVTYGDLAPLYADLPAVGSMAEREAAPPVTAPGCVARRGVLADLPAAPALPIANDEKSGTLSFYGSIRSS